jgi:hypothetical protein
MTAPPRRLWASACAALGALTVLANDPAAYVFSGPVWGVAAVPYYVNTANGDALPAGSVEGSVRVGADAWYLQTNAGFRFSFAGQSSQTTTGYDVTNLVVFRNASSPPAIATTYWWSSNGRILDADIVFWDETYRFFSGTSGCSNGFYIEDIAAHEFGHALGLGHSALTSATMFSSTSSCNTGNRLLDADDVAGVRALYPPRDPPRAPAGLRFTVGQLLGAPAAGVFPWSRDLPFLTIV